MGICDRANGKEQLPSFHNHYIVSPVIPFQVNQNILLAKFTTNMIYNKENNKPEFGQNTLLEFSPRPTMHLTS